MLSKLAAKAGYVLVLTFTSFFAKAQPTASFSATPSSGCAPLVVNFTDESTGGINQWKWDLGNGTISFLKNPSATYLTPGLYTVKLVVRNAGNNADSIVKTDYINVFSKPAVQFTAPNTSGCYPLSVKFTDESTAGSGSVASWNWDFGDGESSTAQNPSHVYSAGGNFNVTLQVKNSNGCVATLSKTAFIQISSGALADFSNDATSSCGAPVTINFQNLSTGTGVLTYKWFFGDGTSSTAINPSHIYKTKGTYTLQLIVTNSNGCTDTATRQNAITVGTVNAAFTSKDSICENSTITFTNTSAPVPAAVTWDFGDGTSATDFNPAKSYTSAGVYNVKLIADFGACTDSAFKKITVLANPIAAFIADDTADCKFPFKVNFTNQSQKAISYKWTFGDGNTDVTASPSHTYNSKNIFTVDLTVTSKEGCTASLKKDNYIRIEKPLIVLDNLPDSACVPFTKKFSSTITSNDPVISYLWKMGDGTTSTSPTPTHTYNTAGTYTVIVEVDAYLIDGVRFSGSEFDLAAPPLSITIN